MVLRKFRHLRINPSVLDLLVLGSYLLKPELPADPQNENADLELWLLALSNAPTILSATIRGTASVPRPRSPFPGPQVAAQGSATWARPVAGQRLRFNAACSQGSPESEVHLKIAKAFAKAWRQLQARRQQAEAKPGRWRRQLGAGEPRQTSKDKSRHI